MSQKLVLASLVFVALPVFVGIVLGANQTRAGAQLPWLFSIVYWVALSVSTWWLMAAGTWLTGTLLRPWLPPPWLIWILGGVAGSFVARPVIYQLASLFRPWMETGQLRAMPPLEFSAQFATYYITNWSAVLMMWLVAQTVFHVLKSLPSVQSMPSTGIDPDTILGSQVTKPEVESPVEPKYLGFLEKLPAFLGRDVIALHSEDHYLRVYTKRGDGLVLVTISEAMRTLEALGFKGLQVHRSWWISLAAVKRTQISDRKTMAVLENEIRVPISQTYKVMFDNMITALQLGR
jgi:hypothetical protein